MPSPTTTSDGYDIAFRVLMAVLAVAVPFSNLAWLGGNIAAWATGSDRWAAYQPAGALLHAELLWPHLGPTASLIATRVVPGVLVVAAAVSAAVLWSRHKNRTGRGKKVAGMAKAKDIEPLLAKAITAKARSLRPSLKNAKQVTPRDAGILLGNLQGTR